MIARDLYQVAQVAGWAVCQTVPGSDGRPAPRYPGFDPMADDALLALVLDEQLQTDYFKARQTAMGRDSTRVTALAQTAYVLSVLASPWCEARAIQAGDPALAARLRGIGDRLVVRAEEALPNDDERVSPLERVAVWEADGVEGYEKLNRLIELALEAAEVHGGMPVRDQAAAIRAGTFVPRHRARWASAIRMACLLTLGRRVPLRVDNVAMIQVLPWTHRRGKKTWERTPHWVAEGNGALWDGAISVNFTAREMKGDRTFHPAIIHQQEVGDAAAESDLRRWLWELFLMPGGAREALLHQPDGTLAVSPYLFPALVRERRVPRGAGQAARGYRWGPQAIRQQFRAMVLKAAPQLGIGPADLRRVKGTASTHIWRHLFGTYFLRRGQLKFASLLLHHKTSAFTERRYTGAKEQEASVDAMRRNSTRRVDDDRAAHAVAGPTERPGAVPPASGMTVLKLIGLLERGVIGQAQFDAACTELLQVQQRA